MATMKKSQYYEQKYKEKKKYTKQLVKSLLTNEKCDVWQTVDDILESMDECDKLSNKMHKWKRHEFGVKLCSGLAELGERASKMEC